MGGFGNKMNFFENNSKLEPHKILVNFIQIKKDYNHEKRAFQ